MLKCVLDNQYWFHNFIYANFYFLFAFYAIVHVQCLYIFTLIHCNGVCTLHDFTSIRLSIIAFFSRTRFVVPQLCILDYSTICRFKTTALRIKAISYTSRTLKTKTLEKSLLTNRINLRCR